MGAKWEAYYELFAQRYRGRSDVVAIQRRDGSFAQLPGALTLERFLEHMNTVNTYGIYQLDDEGRVQFVLFDMDVFPRGKRSWAELLAELPKKKNQVLRLQAILKNLGIHEDQILVEFPTVGYHVLLFFEMPVPVEEARAFAGLALARAGLKHAAPFYPTTSTGYGDMVRLPLRVNNLTGRRSVFVGDLATFDPADYDPTPDFTALERVRPISLTEFRRALQHLTATKDFVPVARVAEIRPGKIKLVEVRGERVLLVNVTGNYYAVQEVCPHAGGCLSEGVLEGSEIECPWHGARFSVTTGEVATPPALQALTRYAVRVEGDDILIGPA